MSTKYKAQKAKEEKNKTPQNAKERLAGMRTRRFVVGMKKSLGRKRGKAAMAMHEKE